MENALPYDKCTEDVILGSVIVNKGEYESVAKYFANINVFYQKKARLLWCRVRDMKRDGQEVDTLTVCSSITKKDVDKGLTKYYITGIF